MQAVVEGEEPSTLIDEVLALLGNSMSPQAPYMVRIISAWAAEQGIAPGAEIDLMGPVEDSF